MRFCRVIRYVICLAAIPVLCACGSNAEEKEEIAELSSSLLQEPETEEAAAVPEELPGDPREAERERILSARLEIPFGEEKEILDAETFAPWLQDSGTGFSLDEEQVKTYVRSLSSKYDTFGVTRPFRTAAGEEIRVAGGNYGYWMDRQSTIDALSKAILSGEQGEFHPVYYSEGAGFHAADIGESYVEVDLDRQHVYVYKNGVLAVESDCVSGKAANGNFTPEGTYAITYKERDATLQGQGYNSKVKYWMPFNGNIGLHDASWRSEFGGEIYLNNGSHGCINLPSSVAPTIYENVEKGEAVVVHGGKQSAPASETAKEPLTKQVLLTILLTRMSAEQVGQMDPDTFHTALYAILQEEAAKRGETYSDAEAMAIITEGEAPAQPQTEAAPAEEAVPAEPQPATGEAVPAEPQPAAGEALPAENASPAE